MAAAALPCGFLWNFLKSSAVGPRWTHFPVLPALTRHPWRFDPNADDLKKTTQTLYRGAGCLSVFAIGLNAYGVFKWYTLMPFGMASLFGWCGTFYSPLFSERTHHRSYLHNPHFDVSPHPTLTERASMRTSAHMPSMALRPDRE